MLKRGWREGGGGGGGGGERRMAGTGNEHSVQLSVLFSFFQRIKIFRTYRVLGNTSSCVKVRIFVAK